MYPPELNDGFMNKEDVFKPKEFHWCGCQSCESDVKFENPLIMNRLETLNTVLSHGYNLNNIPLKRENLLRHFRTSLPCDVFIYLGLVIVLDIDCLSFFLQTLSGTVSDDNECLQMLKGMHLYGCLQSLMKMHPLFDRAIVQLLLQDPNAIVLLLRNNKQSSWQDSQRRRLKTLISMEEQKQHIVTNDTGRLPLDDRVVFMDQMNHDKYMKLLCGMDVSLDPFPFGGGVTLSDSSGGSCGWFGARNVPFITCASLQSVHRIGAGLVQEFNSSMLGRNNCHQMYPDINQHMDDLCSPIGSFRCRIENIGRRMQYHIASYVKGAIELCVDMIQVKFQSNEEILLTEYIDIHKCDKARIEWESFLMHIS